MKPNLWIYQLKKNWYNLLGNDQDFPLESRIYHSFSIIIIISLIIFVPINFLLGIYIAAVLCLITIITLCLTFYISRFKGKTNLAIFISSIIANLSLCINYFYNSGINGPTLLICAITLFVVMMVVRKEKLFTWFVVNFFLISIISFLDYMYPNLVVVNYDERSHQFADIMVSYVIGIIILYFGITYIRNSYQKEKNSSIEKALILEKLNNEKDKLFSIISHDLKTPLASVHQYLELLTHMEIKSNDRKWIESNLLKTTIHTQELLSNLLQWSKNQLKSNDLNLFDLNLKISLKKALEIINVFAEAKNIKLNVIIADDIIVLADVDMLQLIIRNLLYNALKFTPKGGVVDIVASTVYDKCIISIIDNGVGMSKNTQEEAFSLKIKSTYGTDNENGTGLGLVLCKEYTELQGGKIWFSSELNVGSVFNILLPLAIKRI